MFSALRIVVDDRESGSRIPALLREQEGVEVLVRRLSLGDYLIGNRVIIERKTVSDFAASVIDTRLFRQAASLVRSPYRSAILLEGETEGAARTGLPRAAFHGAIVSLTLIFDIPLLRSVNERESVQILVYGARQLAETRLQGPGRRRWKPSTSYTRRLHVLTSLPGIGREKAARLLETFGTVENVIKADADALKKVAGIGPKTAAQMRDLLSSRAADDQSVPRGARR